MNFRGENEKIQVQVPRSASRWATSARVFCRKEEMHSRHIAASRRKPAAKGTRCLRKEEGAPPWERAVPPESRWFFFATANRSPPLRRPEVLSWASRDPFKPGSPEPEPPRDINSKFYGREPVNRITSDARSQGTPCTGTNKRSSPFVKNERVLVYLGSSERGGISYKM